MNRAALGVALAGLVVSFCTTQAKAEIEFCPAALTIRPVGAVPENQPAATYGFILKASGPRNLIATLTFDTDKGWFSSTTPAVFTCRKTVSLRLGNVECGKKQLEFAAHVRQIPGARAA
jgi:hypothetical protein